MYLKVIALLLFVSATSSAVSQTKSRSIDSLLQSFSKKQEFNGAVLVAENGKLLYKKGWGLANMEWKIPNSPSTKFNIGSVTKPFTAMLVMQLVEKGSIRLEAPLSTYLPYYPNSNGGRITIHQLLTHTSGIPDYANFSTYSQFCSEAQSRKDFIKIFADSSLEFIPGTQFSYSNSNYYLLGLIIEAVTGKTYEHVLEQNILLPLGMKNTGYDTQDQIVTGKAAGYEKKDKKYIQASFLHMSVPFAAGAMYSTVEDLWLWEQAIAAQRLLTKNSRNLLFAKHTKSFAHFHYGYGWLTGNQPIGTTTDSVPVIFHSGDINGFTSLFMRLPKTNSLIVLINNTGGAPLFDISSSIIAVLHGRPLKLPNK